MTQPVILEVSGSGNSRTFDQTLIPRTPGHSDQLWDGVVTCPAVMPWIVHVLWLCTIRQTMP